MIRKKHRALKTDRIEEGITLDRYFKSLIEPLLLFAVDSPGVLATKRELRDIDAASAPKRERKEEKKQEDREEVSETFECFTLHKSNDRSHDVQSITSRVPKSYRRESLKNVFETTKDSLVTKIRNQLQTSEGRKTL